jgi:ubiquinone/menaquinone biosynthesis C-methylase UbiE
MDPASRDRRRCSFGPAAEAYERFRPTYPRAAVVWLAGEAPRRVLDVGAGTGKLTRVLLEAGHEVVAVEPDESMRATFATLLPEVELAAGSAEELPLPDSSVDVVVAAQAFHWFDLERAFPEIARVLRPGGIFGVLANLRDESVPWVAELGAVLHGEDGTGYSHEADAPESFGPFFGAVERADFRQVQDLDVEGLVGLAASRSYALTLPDAERGALLARVEALAKREADRTGGLLGLPYITVCDRAARIR